MATGWAILNKSKTN